MQRKTIKSKCQQCNKTFSHRADHPNKYCSRICAGLARRHNIKCKRCGKKVNKSRNAFCSTKCSGLYKTESTVKTILCDECGIVFSRHQCHLRKNNFCSKECANINHSKNYSCKNHPLYYPVGSEKHRVDKNFRARAWIKVADPNVWVQKARWVYEQKCGVIPEGKIIHHKDGDTLNDDIYNLECVTRKWHVNHHRKELNQGRR